MRTDSYEHVSKNNIVTYSYMEDYTKQEGLASDSSTELGMSIFQAILGWCVSLMSKLLEK